LTEVVTPEPARDAFGLTTSRLVGIYAAMVAAMVALSAASVAVFGIRAQGDPPARFRGEGLLEGLFRFDGGWYYGMATSGYNYTPGQQSNVGFFPVYPLLMRAVSWVVGDTVNAGMLITVVAGAVATVLTARWMQGRGLSSTAVALGMAAMLLYPYAWFLYGVVYSDALLLAAALAAALAVESDRPLRAGMLLIVATADRPTGVAIAVGLTVLVAERRGALTHDPERGPSLVRRFRVPNRVTWSALERRDAGILVGFSGLAAYMTFLGVQFGQPLLFVKVQEYWGQSSGFDTLTKRQYWWELTHHVHSSLVMTTSLQGCLLLVGLLLVPFVGRRFGWGYGVSQLCLIASPVYGSKDFMGSGRYLLVLFPAFAFVGEWLAASGRPVRIAYLGISAVTLTVLAAGFAHGMYLS